MKSSLCIGCGRGGVEASAGAWFPNEEKIRARQGNQNLQPMICSEMIPTSLNEHRLFQASMVQMKTVAAT
jgi:hypothetical protein